MGSFFFLPCRLSFLANILKNFIARKSIHSLISYFGTHGAPSHEISKSFKHNCELEVKNYLIFFQ
jgi:hypothetical protein